MSISPKQLRSAYENIKANTDHLNYALQQLNWKSFIRESLLKIKSDIIELQQKEQHLRKSNEQILLQICDSSKQLETNQSLHIFVDILYLDEDICIVNKPANVCIDGEEDVTLEKLTLHTLNVSKLRHCHQLDRATSGAMIYGLTRKAAAKVSQLFQNRNVIKIYYAIVYGHIALDAFIIDAPLTNKPNDPIREMIANHKYHGRAAITECIVKKRGYLKGETDPLRVSLIEVHLHTGRRHQIRLHLSYCGHPIIGDPTYFEHRYNACAFNRMYLDSHRIILELKDSQRTIDVCTNRKYIFDTLIDDDAFKDNNATNNNVALLYPKPHSMNTYNYALMIPFIVGDDFNDIQILIKKSNQFDMMPNNKRKPRSQVLKTRGWNFVCETRLQSGCADAAQTISQTLFAQMPQFARYLIHNSIFAASEFTTIDSDEYKNKTEINAKYLAHHLASNIRRCSMHHCTVLCEPYVIFMVPFAKNIIHDIKINQNQNMTWCSLRQLCDELLCYSPLHLVAINDKRLVMDPLLHFILSNDCISSQKWIKERSRQRLKINAEKQLWMQRYHIKRIDNEPVAVLDNVGIFVGSIKAAKNIKRLKELNITQIIDCTAKNKGCIRNDADGITRLCLPVQDLVTENIVQYMDECLVFIISALKNGENVLVHCWQGASRSVTIVIGYLMKYHHMTLKAALQHIAEKRGAFARPNTGFLLQLMKIEKQLFQCNSFSITAKQMKRYQRKINKN